MKKIGILYGMEHGFAGELLDRLNDAPIAGTSADIVKIGGQKMDTIPDYHVLLDRASGEVPFYKSFLKQAALNGTRVVNDPFVNCEDDNYFHYTMAGKIGLNVPKVVILPSKERPSGASAESMQNMIFPLNWDELFNYVGFPAYLKPNQGKGNTNAYTVYNKHEFFSAYDLTGNKPVILKEAIEYEKYYRVFVIGRSEARTVIYEPMKPHHMRYSEREADLTKKMKADIEKAAIKVTTALGLDFNVVDVGIHNKEIYLPEFQNPFPNLDKNLVYDETYEWVLDNTAVFLTKIAREGKVRSSHHTWSQFLRGPKSPTRKRKKSRLKTNKK